MAAYAVAVYALSPRRGLPELAVAAGAVLLAGVPLVLVWRHRQEALWWRQQCRIADEPSRGHRGEPERLRRELDERGAARPTGGDQEAWARLQGRLDGEVRGFHDRVIGLLREQLPAVVAGPGPVEPAGVLRHARQRVHSLVSRTLVLLDQVEQQVEDPDLLHELYRIDHLVTQGRRAAERMAVLAGESARRARHPLLLATVLRQAVAETEQFSRVRVRLPEPGGGAELAVPAYAGPDLIHLLAELVENATRFSPPHTQVLVCTRPAAQGQVIEVVDRGLAMSASRMQTLNRLLASTERADEGERLGQGQLGMVIVARLARRYGIGVDLHSGNDAGTQARVILPRTVLVAEPSQPQPPSPWAVDAGRAAATGAVEPQAGLPASGAETGVSPTIDRAPAVPPRPAQPLPRRRRTTAPPPQPPAQGRARAAPGPQPAASGDRPALPRRSAAPPSQPADPVPSQAAGQATADLMATFHKGVRQASPATGNHTPRRPPPRPDEPAG